MIITTTTEDLCNYEIVARFVVTCIYTPTTTIRCTHILERRATSKEGNASANFNYAVSVLDTELNSTLHHSIFCFLVFLTLPVYQKQYYTRRFAIIVIITFEPFIQSQWSHLLWQMTNSKRDIFMYVYRNSVGKKELNAKECNCRE